MSLISRLPEILEAGRAQYESMTPGDFRDAVVYGKGVNMMAIGDNMSFMCHLIEKKSMTGKIKMIYVDPPFFSGADHQAGFKLRSDIIEDIPVIRPLAYSDKWESSVETYLAMLCARLLAMRELLSDEGCIWMHLDWHIVHYVKILMDEIFGEKNFINEIIWEYKSGGAGKRHFARKHDTLLLYSKTGKYYLKTGKEKSYNRGLKPYRFKGVEEFQDEHGWYTMVNVKDVWQIDMVGRSSAERTGYATQKPQALLRRIIESTTEKGDICADFFAGSGTMCAAAGEADRKWISCDSSSIAIAAAERRLCSSEGGISVMEDHARTGGRLRRRADGDESVLESDADGPIEQPDAGKPIPAIDAEISCGGTGTDKDAHTVLSLCGYRPDIASLPLDEKDRETIRVILEKDPLLLIEMWSVDTGWDGEVHRADICLPREKTKVPESCMFECRPGSHINIRVIDIFGNRISKTIESEN